MKKNGKPKEVTIIVLASWSLLSTVPYQVQSHSKLERGEKLWAWLTMDISIWPCRTLPDKLPVIIETTFLTCLWDPELDYDLSRYLFLPHMQQVRNISVFLLPSSHLIIFALFLKYLSMLPCLPFFFLLALGISTWKGTRASILNIFFSWCSQFLYFVTASLPRWHDDCMSGTFLLFLSSRSAHHFFFLFSILSALLFSSFLFSHPLTLSPSLAFIPCSLSFPYLLNLTRSSLFI